MIDLRVDEDLKGFSVAPLLFIAFIENAFKYVSHYENKPNKVDISISRKNDQLAFRIFNTKERINGQRLDADKGIGIANAKRRLELLYPEKHELIINSDESSYETRLNLQV